MAARTPPSRHQRRALAVCTANSKVTTESAATELVRAARADDVGALRALLDDGNAVVDAVDGTGSTALIWAAYEDAADAAALLLRRGANANHRNHGNGAALISASFRGAVTCAALLVAADADTNVRFSGRTALDLSVRHGQPRVERLLRQARSLPHLLRAARGVRVLFPACPLTAAEIIVPRVATHATATLDVGAFARLWHIARRRPSHSAAPATSGDLFRAVCFEEYMGQAV